MQHMWPLTSRAVRKPLSTSSHYRRHSALLRARFAPR
jgi:hypothetical protein